MQTPQTLLRRELTGLVAEVTGSTNRSLVGLKGKVTSETRGMLEIETENGKKKIPKAGTTITFTLEGTEATVEGEILIGLPKSRNRRKTKKW